MIRTAVFVS